MRLLQAKLKLLWVILSSKSVHLVYQKYPGASVSTGAYGQGDLRDMILFAKQIKQMHDGFMDMINIAATEAGELHALKELKEATDVIIGEQSDGRN